MNTTALLFVIFATTVLMSVLYWAVVHPVVVKAVQFRLFAIRDEARSKAIQGGYGTLQEYQNMERFMSKLIWIMPHINLFSFTHFAVRQPKVSPEMRKQMIESIPAELVACRERAVKCAIVLMVVNSPLYLLIVSAISTVAVPLVFLLWATDKLTKLRIYQKTEAFVEELPSDGSHRHRGALCVA